MSAFDTDCFARDGYALASGLVSPRLLHAALAAFDEVMGATPRIDQPGMHSVEASDAAAPAIFAALYESDLWKTLAALVEPAGLVSAAETAQLVLNRPPADLELAGPHIDFHQPTAERPRSFTFLVGILLSDQTEPDTGNLWVWPGTHHLFAEYLTEYGPASLCPHGGSLPRAAPGVRLPRPVAICGRAGDVVVAHPLLGHTTGPNTQAERRAAYFLLPLTDHDRRWAQCVTQPLLEYNL